MWLIVCLDNIHLGVVPSGVNICVYVMFLSYYVLTIWKKLIGEIWGEDTLGVLDFSG